ncbi:MAG: PAS domain S-box protein [Gracilimonas sp.]
MARFIDCKLDVRGNWQELPQKLCDMLGYSRHELKKISLVELIHQQSTTDVEHFFSTVEQKDYPKWEAETKLLTKSGESIPVHASLILLRNPEGDPDHILLQIQHISHQNNLHQNFESLFKYNPHSVFYFDSEGTFLEANKKFEELSGYSAEKLRDKSFEQFIHPDDIKRTQSHFIQALNGEIQKYEITGITKAGQERQVHITNFPFLDGDEIIGVFGICEDFTEHKIAEKKLKRSEQRFKSLFEHNPNAVFSFDAQGYMLEANKALEEISGYSIEDLRGKHFETVTAPKDNDRVKEKFEQVLHGKPQTYEAESIHKNGSRYQVQVTNIPIHVDGEIDGVFGIAQDITQQRKTEQKLQENEQLFRSLFTYSPYPVMRFDLEGNFMDSNDKAVEMSGYTKEELLETGFSSFIPEEDLEKISKHFEKAASGEPQYYEMKAHTRNYEVIYVESSLSPIYVKDEIVGLYCIAKDITKQKKAEQKLIQSEDRWHQLVQYNPQPVLILQDGKIVFINEFGMKFLGASSAEELIGKPIFGFIHNDHLEIAKERKHKLEKNEHLAPYEYKFILPNNENRYVESHSIPITYKGQPAVQMVIQDISELKEKQHHIGKSLKEKETLLKEIHHRVKNNLAVISGLLELQQMNISDENIINALMDSQLRIKSMAMIHEKLYQSETLHEIGFDAYLKELVDSISSTYESSYKKVTTHYELDRVALELDQAIPCSLIINEVIVNCYKHAFDHDYEGEINITLTHKDPEIILEITDNGSGLPKDFDINSQQSLGTTLIGVLTGQLNGEMHFTNRKNGSGTKFKLQFEMESAKF